MFQNSDAEVPAYSVLTTTFFQAKIISKSAFVTAERKLGITIFSRQVYHTGTHHILLFINVATLNEEQRGGFRR
jgi:hypothetical protein